jgi:hypothetical protein
MKLNWTYSFLLIIATVVLSNGQISPGDLSTAHSHLEGITNCTQCHDLGNKVPDKKCLDCHSEIDNLILLNRGFHVSSDVSAKKCIDCHNEHHGRKFNMVRFDENVFDHDLAGYSLEGKHAIIECRDCHQPDYIKDSEISKRESTFLGLETACLDCHDDFHQQTLGNDCLQCHNFDSFDPASRFNHNETEFTLKGAHVSVDCIECHPIKVRNGNDFQQFTNLAFNNCVDCHSDPHSSQLTGTCTQCHTESSFTNFIGRGKFDHNQTNFELKGRHKTINCFECHNQTSNANTVFQDILNISENNCIECHDDVHEGKFGFECIKCHTEESFFTLKDMEFFDHSVTNFPLEGEHVGVDCNSCHGERLMESIDFSECKNCHVDYHSGEFTKNGTSPDCIECHTLDEKFAYTTYGFEDHKASSFPLEGSHMATPCFACHVSEDHWSFRDIGESCVDCHDDIHDGFITEKYYPDKNCSNCHASDSWKIVIFDHSTTDWPLSGQHSSTDCRSCHFEENQSDGGFSQEFANLNSQCIECHENVHDDQFSIDGVTDCIRCHITDNWLPENFNHNATRFPLDGAHLEIECRACHTDEKIENGKTKVIYKIERFECIDCHL